MIFKRSGLIALAGSTLLLLSACSAPTTQPNTTSPSGSAAATPAAASCPKSVTATLPSDLFAAASCVQLAETKEREDVNLPQVKVESSPLFASGATAVYSAVVAGSQTSADQPYLYGYEAGKKVWEIKLDGADETFAAVMVNGTPQIRVQVPVADPGDAVNKASASWRFDFYTFDGKKIKSVAGLANSAAYDEENSTVKDPQAEADTDGATGYTATNDGLYYASPEADKITFLTADGWTRSIKGGYAAGDGYGEYAYTANRTILGYNAAGYLSDEYTGLEHTYKDSPSNFQFTTWAGKVLWSVPVSHSDSATGATAEVYGDTAHVAYTEALADGNEGPAFEGWVNIETGKQVDPKTFAATVKPYRNLNPAASLREPNSLVGDDDSLVYVLFGGTSTEGQAEQVALGADGTKHSLDESDGRNKLVLTGVSGSTYYGAEGLRYDANSDKATVSTARGDFTPSLSVDGGAYFTVDQKVYYVKNAA